MLRALARPPRSALRALAATFTPTLERAVSATPAPHDLRVVARVAAATAAALAALQATQCEAQAPSPTRSIVLRDGRKLAFRDEGDGIPVIAFHGMGSSHHTWFGSGGPVPGGVRLIAVDRPGYGDSSQPPCAYSYTQFAADIIELADALRIERFSVAGHSSGGPYALALAALHPTRVVSCAAVSSDPPYAHPEAPAKMRAADDMSADASKNGRGFYGQDPTVAASTMRAKALAGAVPAKAHAWKQGVEGWVVDFTLERVPWSFRLEAIEMGRACSVWVGSEDLPPIVEGAPFIQRCVPGSQLHVVDGGDHGFKSQPEHLASIMRELCSHW